MPDYFWKRIPVIGRIALDIVIVDRAVVIKALAVFTILSPLDTQ
jgi:hypothetical protein